MSAITLRKALGVLAKSSSFSVTTVTHRQKDEFDQLKEQLFVKQEIETELQRYLDVAKPGEIIFLCGSSGDGKSEILTRCKSNLVISSALVFIWMQHTALLPGNQLLML